MHLLYDGVFATPQLAALRLEDLQRELYRGRDQGTQCSVQRVGCVARE